MTSGNRRAARESRGATRLIVLFAVGVAVAVVAAVVIVMSVIGPPRELERGAKYLAEGRREGARQQFEEAARKDPSLAMPYVYLGRMAREDGDLARAQLALKRAVELEPQNAVALREYASLFLASGNLDLAERFYKHAIIADTTDKLAMGFLGCTLMRLRRTDEAMRWFERAGPGEWTVCAQPPPPPPPGRGGLPPGS